MIALIIRRVFQSIVVMLVVALLAFTLFRYVGDPVAMMVGQETSLDSRVEGFEPARDVFSIGDELDESLRRFK